MRKSWFFTVAFVLMTLVASKCAAQEKKIKRSDLPAAVEKTVAAQSQGATIRGFSEEKEKGKTYYEVEMIVNGHGKDVTMDQSGSVTEVEEEVQFDSLPAAVQQGLKTKAGKGTINKVESITKRGKLVAYEADIVTAGKKSEIQVGPEGQALDHEE